VSISFSVHLQCAVSSQTLVKLITFVEVENRLAEGLSSVLVNGPQHFNLKDRLVTEMYDSAAVMSGSS